MNNSSQFIKGLLAPIVLQMLHENGKMYGYEITRKVKETTAGKLQLTEGALYPCLHKLESEGKITATFELVGNRQRKYYALTKAGKKEMPEIIGTFREFWQQMAMIFNLQKA